MEQAMTNNWQTLAVVAIALGGLFLLVWGICWLDSVGRKTTND
jgi:hypothetical protein